MRDPPLIAAVPLLRCSDTLPLQGFFWQQRAHQPRLRGLPAGSVHTRKVEASSAAIRRAQSMLHPFRSCSSGRVAAPSAALFSRDFGAGDTPPLQRPSPAAAQSFFLL